MGRIVSDSLHRGTDKLIPLLAWQKFTSDFKVCTEVLLLKGFYEKSTLSWWKYECMNLANQMMCVSRATFSRTKAPPAKKVDHRLGNKNKLQSLQSLWLLFFSIENVIEDKQLLIRTKARCNGLHKKSASQLFKRTWQKSSAIMESMPAQRKVLSFSALHDWCFSYVGFRECVRHAC